MPDFQDQSLEEQSSSKNSRKQLKWLEMWRQTTNADRILLFMMALIPPLHAGGFERADDFKMPFFALLTTAYLWFALKAVRFSKFLRIVGLVTLIYLAIRFFVDVDSLNWWSVGAWLPLIASILLISSSQESKVQTLPFPLFGLATSVGVLSSALFSIPNLFGYDLGTTPWLSINSLAPFDNIELALPYYIGAAAICTTAVITTRGPIRYICALAGITAASILGGFEIAIPSFILPIFFVALGLYLLVLNRRRNEDDRMPAVAFIIAGILLGSSSYVGHVFYSPTPDEKSTISMFGDSNWADSLPSIDRENNPIFKVGRGTTEFGLDRWEMVDNQDLLTQAHQIAYELFEFSPVFGLGPNGFWKSQSRATFYKPELTSQDPTHYLAFKTPHNGYLHYLVETGIVGVLLLLVLFSLPVALRYLDIQRLKKEGGVTLDGRKVVEITGLAIAYVSILIVGVMTPHFQLVSPLLLLSAIAIYLMKRDFVEAETEVKKPLQAAKWFFLVVSVAVVVASVGHSYARHLKTKGDHFMLVSNFEKARDRYMDALAFSPDNSELHLNIGITKLLDASKKDYLDIVKDFSTTVDLRPYDARGYFYRAKALVQNKQPDKAMRDAKVALKFNPSNNEACLLLASISQAMFDYKESLHIIDECLTRPTSNEYARELNRLGGFVSGDLLQQHATAIPYYKRALELSSTEEDQKEIANSLQRSEYTKQIKDLEREGKTPDPELLKKLKELEHNHDHHNHGH